MELHIDTANQLDNTWYRDSVVGIRSACKSFAYTICIPHSLKLKIRDKLKEFSDKDVVAELQVYLVFLILREKEGFLTTQDITNTWLCPDIRPKHLYTNRLQRCFSFHGKPDFFLSLKFKIKKHEEKSKAHPVVRRVFQNKKRANKIFRTEDIDKFLEYFRRQSIKKIN